MRFVKTFVGFALMALALSPVWAGQAGLIEFVEGEVHITARTGQQRAASVNGSVDEGDVLSTGSAGEIHLRMQDQALVAVRPNSRLRIDAYRAIGDAEDGSTLSLLKGTLRAVSGWIGLFNRNRYSIRTATATIGIRGTDHEPAYFGPESSAAERAGHPHGTYDKVNSGETYIENGAGRAAVVSGAAGFASGDLHAGPPRVLEKIPSFYHRTKNESRFESKLAQQAKNIETKRQEAVEKLKAAPAHGAGSASGGSKSANGDEGTKQSANEKQRATHKQQKAQKHEVK